MVCMYAHTTDSGYTRKIYFQHVILVISVNEVACAVKYSHQTHDDPSLEEDYDYFPEPDQSLLREVCRAALLDLRGSISGVAVHLNTDVYAYVKGQCSAVLQGREGAQHQAGEHAYEHDPREGRAG